MRTEGDVPVVTPKRVRLVVVADVRFYRDGLATHLSHQPNFVLVGSAANAMEAIPLIVAQCPDIVVLDMVTTDSIDIVRRVRAVAPAVKIVAFGVADAERGILACAEAGLAGYVTSDQSMDDLTAMIESVARGELHCSPRVAATLFRRLAHLAARLRPQSAVAVPLTLREREIGALIQRGLSNKEIAAQLQIEVPTVKNHVHNILEKLEVGTRGEAAARLRGVRSTPRELRRFSLGDRISREFQV